MWCQWHFFFFSALAFHYLSGDRDVNSRTCEVGREEVLVRGPPVGQDSTWSNSDTNRLGRFHSPKPYEDGRLATRCVYRFVANVGEKVHIKFDRFQLTGLMPRCTEAFLDVYIDVASTALDVNRENAVLNHLASEEQRTTTPFSAAVYSTVLDRSELLGRFCGSIRNESALQFVSLHHEIVLDFYSESTATRLDRYQLGKHGFSGTYEFINDDAKREKNEIIVGQLAMDLSGELISPTYPGLHPDGMVCAYQLAGLPTQRIAVEIEELQLAQSQKECFLDFMVFYDIATDGSNPKLIGERFCGRKSKLAIVSTGPNLLIAFVTGQNVLSDDDLASTDVRLQLRRGFRLRYTFSESILPIEKQYVAQHIRGTECDYRLHNQGYREAIFESPGYTSGMPLQPGKSCSTFFIGARNDEFMETVRIRFEGIVLSNRSFNSRCHDQGSIDIYGVRSIGSVYQLNEPLSYKSKGAYGPGLQLDLTLCNPRQLVTSGNTVDTTGHVSLTGRNSAVMMRLQAPTSLKSDFKAGYRAAYHFVKDFGIPGMAMSTKYCQFLYTGRSPHEKPGQIEGTGFHSSGWTNSPHFPFSPPPNITCTYLFTPSLSGTDEHLIRLTFSHFDPFHGQSELRQTKKISNSKLTSSTEFVEVVELTHPLTQEGVSHIFGVSENSVLPFSGGNNSASSAYSIQIHKQNAHSIRLYYEDRIPGPFLSSSNVSGILVRYRSAQSLTFALRYEFINKMDKRAVNYKCGHNIRSIGGIVETPNFPHSLSANLSCVWTLQAENPTSNIQLHFEQFNLVDCSQAVILLFPGTSFQPTHQFCGQKMDMPAIIIASSLVRVQLITVGESGGRKGFRLVWTEIWRNAGGNICYDFQCMSTKLCISNLLKCNGVSNCGTSVTENGNTIVDNSDEEDHCSTAIAYSPVHIGIGVLLTFLILLALITFIYLRERGRRLKHALDPLAQLGLSKHSLTSAQSVNTKSMPVCLNDALLSCPVSRSHRRSSSTKKISGTVQFPQTTSRDFFRGKDKFRILHSHPQHTERHTCTRHSSGRNGVLQAYNRSCEHLAERKAIHLHSGKNVPLRHRVAGRLPPRSRCISSLPRDASGRRGTQLTPSGSLSADIDGGLLIREKMQKISIV